MANQINSGLFSSVTDQHNTPIKLVDRIAKFLMGIDLDPCTSPNNPCLAKRFFTEADNGLSQPWVARNVYMNPPYGRSIGLWTNKLDREYRAGHFSEAIALLPARTDTRWWLDICKYMACFICGRLKFNDCGQSAPFPSVLIYLGSDIYYFSQCFDGIGNIYTPDGLKQ